MNVVDFCFLLFQVLLLIRQVLLLQLSQLLALLGQHCIPLVLLRLRISLFVLDLSLELEQHEVGLLEFLFNRPDVVCQPGGDLLVTLLEGHLIEDLYLRGVLEPPVVLAIDHLAHFRLLGVHGVHNFIVVQTVVQADRVEY